jgi:O-methyltransferase involved in polyketide biosynthesis
VPDTISPTAHYTGAVWARNGLSHPALATAEGRVLFGALQPTMLASRLLGGPGVEGMLLARHRIIDARLTEAIESRRVGQVIEVAAGMSPRGWRFSRRYGERLTYVEADLPAMAERKRRALTRAGALGDRHRVVDLDALTDSGRLSLPALAGELDGAQGLAVVTEGLLNYFDRNTVERLWERIAGVLDGFPDGVYLSDIVLDGAVGGFVPRAFMAGLMVFVRGRVHLHFAGEAELERGLLANGFDAVAVHQAAGGGPREDPSVRMVRVIEASAAT